MIGSRLLTKTAQTLMKMAGSKVLLDSNIVIDFFKGDAALVSLFEQHQLLIPAICIGELSYGALKSSAPYKKLASLNALVGSSTILAVDVATANVYGSVKLNLVRKGRPIPENDIWIAAVAIQHQLPLATRDRHFDEVDSLQIMNW